MKATYRPIGADWPGERTPPRQRRHSPFKRGSRWDTDGQSRIEGGPVSWEDTLTLLETELRQLEAKDLVIQIDLRESEIRLDGMPRSDARPQDPAVILSFQSKHGPLRYYCDRFSEWKDNVRAVALGLESLRRVERYGITRKGEQYAGWQQLPPARSPAEGVVYRFPNRAEAAAYLVAKALRGEAGQVDPERQLRMADIALLDKQYRDDLFRRASKWAHPDAGGSQTEWETLVEARRVVETEPALA